MAEAYKENPKKQSWRDILPIHPAAELLPLMDQNGQRNLGRNIKANGLQVPAIIHVDANGRRSLLDGRNRLDGIEYVGLPVLKDGALDPELYQEISGDPLAYVLSANLHRRHLSTKDKRDLAGELLKRMPDKSDRQIAALVGISHHTVACVRRELEGRGQIAHSENREDAKGRRQPATKSATKTNGVDPEASAKEHKAQHAALEAAETFDHLIPIEIRKFVESIASGQRRRLDHALGHDDAAHAEIATLAREARGLLAHAEHNKNDIHKRLARIVAITDRRQKFLKSGTTKGNGASRHVTAWKREKNRDHRERR
jgi:hypothetical protein